MYKIFIVVDGKSEEITQVQEIKSENEAAILGKALSEITSGCFQIKNGSFICIPESKMKDVYFIVGKVK